MEDFDAQPKDGIAIGTVVRLETGQVGTVKDIYIKGDDILAQITLTSGGDEFGIKVKTLTPANYSE